MEPLSNYLEKHLKDYIIHELEVGYSLESIQRVLLGKGHRKDMIQNVIDSIDFSGIKPARRKPIPAKPGLDKELFYYIKNLVIQYILDQMEKGFSLEEIKRVLKSHGHDELIINHAVNSVQGKDSFGYAPAKSIQKPVKYETSKKPYDFFSRMPKNKAILLMAIVIAFGSIFFVGVLADQSLIKVGMILFPVLATMLIGFALGTRLDHKMKPIIMVIALAFSALFFYLNKAGTVAAFSGIDYGKFTIMNIIITMVIAAIYQKLEMVTTSEMGNKNASGGDSSEMPKMPRDHELYARKILDKVSKE